MPCSASNLGKAGTTHTRTASTQEKHTGHQGAKALTLHHIHHVDCCHAWTFVRAKPPNTATRT